MHHPAGPRPSEDHLKGAIGRRVRNFRDIEACAFAVLGVPDRAAGMRSFSANTDNNKVAGEDVPSKLAVHQRHAFETVKFTDVGITVSK
jgi:hypothetical protein